MALDIDSAASGVGAGTGPFTYSHTCSGSNRVLFVKTSVYDSIDSVSDVTYNGVSLTYVTDSAAINGQYTVEWYYMIDPPTGTNTVSVTVTGNVFDIGVASISYTDAHQTTPYGTPSLNTSTGTTPTVNVSSVAGEIVMDGLIITHGSTLTVGAGQTQRANAICGAGFIKHAASTEPGATTTTMSWLNGNSQDWAMSALAVKPVDAVAEDGILVGSGKLVGGGIVQGGVLIG